MTDEPMTQGRASDVAVATLDVVTAIEAAEALATEGRRRDAIRLLTDANRASGGDGRIERRLVEIRHDAFDEQVAARTPRPSWPPAMEDPFPGLTGVPECTRDELTTELIGGAVLHHGCLLVRGLLAPDEVERMRDDIDRAFESRAAFTPGSSGDRWYQPFEPGFNRAAMFGQANFVRAADSPKSLFDLLDIYERVGLLDMLTEYLGEPPVLSCTKCALRRVPTDDVGTDFHQDGAFLGEGIRVMNVWTTLTRCGDGIAPGLDLVPRRFHRVIETGTMGALFDWTVSERKAAIEAGEAGIVGPVYEPGDGVLFDEMFLHRTDSNSSMTVARYALESWFFAPSIYPDRHVPLAV